MAFAEAHRPLKLTDRKEIANERESSDDLCLCETEAYVEKKKKRPVQANYLERDKKATANKGRTRSILG